VSYRIDWEEEALQELQRLYDESLDKEGFVNCLVRLGLELSANAPDAGESRDKGRRVLFKYPLIVWFYTNERLNEVVIYQVRPWLW
jgi:hypothetical protein